MTKLAHCRSEHDNDREVRGARALLVLAALPLFFGPAGAGVAASPAFQQAAASPPLRMRVDGSPAMRLAGSEDSINAPGLPSPGSPSRGEASSAPSLLPPPSTTARTGVYRFGGVNGRGEPVAGIAALVSDGDIVQLTVFNGIHLYRGKGRLDGGVVGIVYNDGRKTTLKLYGDGRLAGPSNLGGDSHEEFKPIAFAAPVDAPLVEGAYRVVGKQPDGKPTSGTVVITKSGRGFHFAWSYDDGDKLEAWGTLADNLLTIDGRSNARFGWPKDAAIIYALAPDGSLAGLYAAGLGEERLTPVGEPGLLPAPEAVANPKQIAEMCVTTMGTFSIPACDKAIASGSFSTPDLAQLHDRRGLLYFLENESGAAAKDYSEAIRLDASKASYFGNRGNAYLAKGDYDAAIADFDEALRLAPEESVYFQSRGLAYLKKGLAGPARDDFDKALSLNPDAGHSAEIERTLKQLGPDYRKMKVQ